MLSRFDSFRFLNRFFSHSCPFLSIRFDMCRVFRFVSHPFLITIFVSCSSQRLQLHGHSQLRRGAGADQPLERRAHHDLSRCDPNRVYENRSCCTRVGAPSFWTTGLGSSSSAAPAFRRGAPSPCAPFPRALQSRGSLRRRRPREYVDSTCVCMHVCMYVSICVYIYIYVYVYLYIYIYRY